MKGEAISWNTKDTANYLKQEPCKKTFPDKKNIKQFCSSATVFKNQYGNL